MKRLTTTSFAALLLVAAIALAAGCGGSSSNDNSSSDASPAFSSSELAALPNTNWITNGGSISNQRYSPLDQINAGNVGRLKGLWHIHLGSGTAGKYSGEAQPIVYKNVIYVITGADDVFAIDAKSGATKWSYRANLNQKINTICCGWTNRGVALGDGRVYFGQLDGKVVALDQKNGQIAWTKQLANFRKGTTITSAPLYYNGRIYIGMSGGEYGIRGRLTALDAKTGSEAWRFYTIPGPGEVGHETWPSDNDSWKHGGAPVWQTPSVDPQLGLLYFSTGNASPDFNGAARAGDNLFSSSILALDAKTGKYRWHFQQVHHDIWDYDAPSPTVLFDVSVGGKQRHAIAEAGKTGWVYILDRENGRPLIGIDEKAVPQAPSQKTAPTQPYPRGDATVVQSVQPDAFRSFAKTLPKGTELTNGGRIFTPYTPGGTSVSTPSSLGGTNWLPMSYNRKTKLPLRLRHSSRRSSSKAGRRRSTSPARVLAGSAIAPQATPFRHLHGDRRRDQPDRLAEAVQRLVLQRVDDHGRQSRLRRPQRRPPPGLQRHERQPPLELPDRGRREQHRQRLLAGRQAGRRVLRSRQRARRKRTRRRSLALRARREARAGEGRQAHGRQGACRYEEAARRTRPRHRRCRSERPSSISRSRLRRFARAPSPSSSRTTAVSRTTCASTASRPPTSTPARRLR